MTLFTREPRKALFSLDTVLQATGLDATTASRRRIALGVIARAGWPYPESREAWRDRHARLRGAIDGERFACCFDRVGRLAGGAAWTIAGGEIRLSDFWASRGALPGVIGELRSRIAQPGLALVYQRSVRGRVRERRYRLSPRGHAGRPATRAVDEMTERKDLLDGCADLLRQALECGELLTVLAASPAYGALSTAAALQLSGRWSGLHQYRLYRDSEGHPSGLLAWAWLSDRTIADLPRALLHRLPHGEWNEGERLCLTDVVTSPATRGAIAADIAGGLFPDEAELLTYQCADAKPAVTWWKASERPRLAQLATASVA